MGEQQTPERPPTSGRGSGADAWREYAAAVTDSPAESWAALSREEIIELLDGEGVTAADTPAEDQAAEDQAAEVVEPAPRLRSRPVWMVPTADGDVPEHELRRR